MSGTSLILKRVFRLFSCLLITIYSLTLGFADEVDHLIASDGQARDNFGYSCAISSDYAFIGSPNADGYSGKVYIYKRNASNNWDDVADLTLPDSGNDGYFGYDVKVDGDYAIIGAPFYNNNEGSAYVYKLEDGSWNLMQTLELPDPDVEGFGESVAIKDPYLLIAAPYENGGNGNGKAFLYKRSGDSWDSLEIFSAPESEPADNSFAFSVALSTNNLIITSPVYDREGSGQAYVYANNNDNWNLVSTVTPPDDYAIYRGSVSLTDSYMAISLSLTAQNASGAVLVYRNSGGSWAQSQVIKSPDSTINIFGAAVCINDSALVISDLMVNPGGAVYKYTLNGTQWDLEKNFLYPGTEYFSQMGTSISLYNDEYLLAGNPTVKEGTGDAYLWYMNSSYVAINVDPSSSGSTDPASGIQHEVTTNEAFSIKATPASGYTFNGWDVKSGTVIVANPASAETTATVNGVAEITAKFVAIATVTFAVTPEGSGTTTPSVGSIIYPIGDTLNIKAKAADGYYFHRWHVYSGAAVINDPTKADTEALVNGDCSIMAVFQQASKDVQLTMALSPEAGGTVQPIAGIHQVISGSSVTIQAEPASDMHFLKWGIQGTGTISEPLSSTTTVSITENSTITAYFARNSAPVTLTMAVSPDNSGSTNPNIGDTTVSTNQPVRIQAHPVAGYHFVDWSISGTGTIDGSKNTIAWATLSGNATVTANFAVNTQQANLTMAVSPADSGICNPGIGVHEVNVGETYEINATPHNGYYFSKWNTSGEAKVTSPLLADTYVKLSGNAIVTAVFNKAIATTKLIISSNPTAGGSTNPGTGEHQVVVGKSIKVEAHPNSGYYFTHWSLKGSAIISDTDSAETVLTVYGQTALTANFAEASKSAVLTMQVSPENSGSTNPGLGAHTVTIGKNISLKADASENYYFERWQITGGGSIDNPEVSETEAVLTGDATITAIFSAIGPSAQLILAVDPVAGGATNPGTGFYTVPVGYKYSVKAIPADGYYFDSWQSDENIEIEDRYAEFTYVELSGNSTLVAVFEEKTSVVNLTISASPENSGTTNPGLGTYSINKGDRFKIEAIPALGYHFTNWEITSGTASIDNRIDKDTYIKTTTDSTIVANFAVDETPVSLEMKVSPENSGFTSPGVGSHADLFAGQTVEIQAIPAEGYHFVNWTSSGANIYNDLAAKTLATLIGNATITANFATNENPLTLSIINSNIEGGLTYPVPGKHTYYAGQSIKLEAAPFKDYHFVKWELNGDGYIENDKAESAYAVLGGNSTITAVFTEEVPLFLSVGSVITIDAVDYDETRKWIFTTFYNKAKAESVPNKRQFCNVLYDRERKEITGEWRCKIRLYNPKDYPKKEKLSNLLTVNPVQDMKLYGIYVRSKKQEPIQTNLTGYIVSPKIDSISGKYSEKGDVFIVKGRYFGAKLPAVCLEYTVNDNVYYKRCKIIKEESLRYTNALGLENTSCMKIWASDTVDATDVGYSQISVVYPKLRKNAIPTGYIILKNSSGMTPGKFPEIANLNKPVEK